jgi:hypothetical protein
MDYYLDQNVYDHCLLEVGLSSVEIAALLRDREIRIIPSEHNIHETVSCWKSGALIDNQVPGPFLDSKSENLTRGDLIVLASGGLQKSHCARLENRWTKKQNETKFYEGLRQEGFFGQLHRTESFEAFIGTCQWNETLPVGRLL